MYNDMKEIVENKESFVICDFNIKDIEILHFAINQAIPHTNKRINGYKSMLEMRDKLSCIIRDYYRNLI